MLALLLPYTQQTISILRFHCGRQIFGPLGGFRPLWPVASPCALWPALVPCGQPFALWPALVPCGQPLCPVASPCALWPALVACGQPLCPVASPYGLWPPTTQTHPFYPPHPPPALSPHPIAHSPAFQFLPSFRPFQFLSPFLCHFGYLGGQFLPFEPLTYPFSTPRSYTFYIPHKYRFLEGGATF
jgi:hypothetical protein